MLDNEIGSAIYYYNLRTVPSVGPDSSVFGSVIYKNIQEDISRRSESS